MSNEPKQYSDVKLVCRDCGHEFIHSAGEQSWYEKMRFSAPRRCPNCRATYKKVLEHQGKLKPFEHRSF
jgi:DNA-directed RNA polymerase subunit RPC12/RpoP